VKAVGRRVQAVVVTVNLYLLYVFGIGSARLYARLFHRRLLQSRQDPAGSYWRELPPVTFDRNESLRQS